MLSLAPLSLFLEHSDFSLICSTVTNLVHSIFFFPSSDAIQCAPNAPLQLFLLLFLISNVLSSSAFQLCSSYISSLVRLPNESIPSLSRVFIVLLIIPQVLELCLGFILYHSSHGGCLVSITSLSLSPISCLSVLSLIFILSLLICDVSRAFSLFLKIFFLLLALEIIMIKGYL